jgi:hypothetical protein
MLIAINIFLIALESEINVQHVIDSAHVEVLGIEPVILVLVDGIVNKTSLLVTAGLHILLVKEVLDVKREAKLVFTLDVP